MLRPQRIEYEHAFYHVMNRGKGRSTIFQDDVYYQSFLDILADVCFRFDCLVHAYCLMGTHYHLLIETPKANLSRIMKHINSVYTLRYNHLNQSDGPLFRGRFKAILVDHKGYLLQLSRYIHRSPIDMKRPVVTQLADYPWSSYPAYVGKAKPTDWLAQNLTYRMLSHKDKHQEYANYVMAGIDNETAQLYGKAHMPSIIGGKEFRERVNEELLPQLAAPKKSEVIGPDLTMPQVISGIANDYGVTEDDITKVLKGRQKENEARKFAMYLCQELVAAKLSDIATQFHLSNVGSVSFTTHQVRKCIKEDSQFSKRVEGLIKRIMKQAT